MQKVTIHLNDDVKTVFENPVFVRVVSASGTQVIHGTDPALLGAVSVDPASPQSD